MNDFLKDIQYAFRMMLKHRSFTFIAVLAVALGIGARSVPSIRVAPVNALGGACCAVASAVHTRMTPHAMMRTTDIERGLQGISMRIGRVVGRRHRSASFVERRVRLLESRTSFVRRDDALDARASWGSRSEKRFGFLVFWPGSSIP